MDEEGDFRKWDELLPDALGLIFKNLSLYEILTVAPRVCKSWGKTVMGPYCWQEIDIEEWSRNSKPEIVDRMLQMLITRSGGSVRKLSVSGLSSDQSFLFITNRARTLGSLRLPRSAIDDSIMEKSAVLLSNLTYLDLSYCINIGARALQAIGKNCKCLTSLRRIMHPLDVIDKLTQKDEALAMATTMPRLKHLEIAYLLVDTVSIIEILENCKYLELLDVRGCWNVNLDEDFVKRFPRLKMIGPLVDCYDVNGWDNYSVYSGLSGYLAWDFVAGEMDDDSTEILDDYWEDENPDDDFELRFYDEFSAVDADYDW